VNVADIAISPTALQGNIAAALGALAQSVKLALGEVTVTVAPEHYAQAMKTLREGPACQFEQLVDLCGMDYSTYGASRWQGARFAVVAHLLSVRLNQRVRVRMFCADDALPAAPSVTSIWNSANWFEREAFDMYGIVFEGHADLRRILTDYGFIGHPLRKDFPLIGHVEMRYDAQRQRVVYEPVTIEQREITPRVIRADNYGGLH
jgi:NADH-quinone oxidoreductase subunit C